VFPNETSYFNLYKSRLLIGSGDCVRASFVWEENGVLRENPRDQAGDDPHTTLEIEPVSRW